MKYRVFAQTITDLYVDVEADSAEQATELALDKDLSEYETDGFEFQIGFAEESK
jgi:hypothetical protein